MNLRHIVISCVVTAFIVVGTGFGTEKADALDGAFVSPGVQTADSQGVQVLTRGPVHEAFAETITFNPGPGVVVTRAPRDIIEELPPDQRPDGGNVTWIPGYWAWDDERTDYLWVSGIWRDLPPGRQWTPGYWGQANQGYQWTSGYWADASIAETEYLPQPPASLEVGPNIAATAANLGWVPGCWIWQSLRYVWRPGYWAAGRPDWDWIPAHYTWAPRGYVYSDGYWDHSVSRRGVLFAPVYFDQRVYARPNFSYSPAIVINLSVFTDQLFLRPQYQHYYFGDYYAQSYQNAGYYSPFESNSNRYGYDPIFARQRWEHRNDRNWEQQRQAVFMNRRNHEDARPVRTFDALKALVARGVTTNDQRVNIATPLAQFITRNDSPMRFQPVARDERQKFGQLGRQVQQYRGERNKLETQALIAPGAKVVQPVEQAKAIPRKPPNAGRPADQPGRSQAPPIAGPVTVKPAKMPPPAKPAERPVKILAPPIAQPVRVKGPKSPIIAKPIDQLRKGQAPPKRHQVPKPDAKLQSAPGTIASAPPAALVVKQPRASEPPKAKTQDAPKGNSKDKGKDESKDKSRDKSKDASGK